MKNATGMFIGMEVNGHITLGSVAIFTILILQPRRMEGLSIGHFSVSQSFIAKPVTSLTVFISRNFLLSYC